MQMITDTTTWRAAIIISVLGCIVYANSLQGAFLWDDLSIIKDNAYIKSWSRISLVFSGCLGAGAGRLNVFYRPLQSLTYMADYSLWKLKVAGFHLQNIAWHIAASLCVYWLIQVLFKDARLSLIAALLFVVHPVHTEAVSYISGRADPLSLTFMLLTLIFYIREKTIPAVICSLFALLSKESSLILPFLILLYHYTFRKRIQVPSFSLITASACAYIMARITVLRYLLESEHIRNALPYPERVAGFLMAMTHYVRLLVIPVHLHMEYIERTFSFSRPEALIGSALLVSALLCVWFLRKVRNVAFFSITWFLLALMPNANILFPVNAYMAEHWLYVPSVGVFLLVSHAYMRLFRTHGPLRAVSVASLCAVILIFSFLTMRQNRTWREPVAFYERALRYAPQSGRVRTNLGVLYDAMGRDAKAAELFKSTADLETDNYETLNNLANIYKDTGRQEEAVALYKKVLRANPRFLPAYNNLGNVYMTRGNAEEALRWYREAVRLFPQYAEAYNNIGVLYYQMKRYDEAITFFKKAIEANPAFVESYNDLGSTYCEIGKTEEAYVYYKKALEVDPANAEAHNNLAVTYYYDKRYDAAIRHCGEAVRLGYKVDPEFLAIIDALKKGLTR